MFAPYRFKRCASTKDLCRLCLRAEVFLGASRQRRKFTVIEGGKNDVAATCNSACNYCTVYAGLSERCRKSSLCLKAWIMVTGRRSRPYRSASIALALIPHLLFKNVGAKRPLRKTS
jgi:hypothetical protein